MAYSAGYASLSDFLYIKPVRSLLFNLHRFKQEEFVSDFLYIKPVRSLLFNLHRFKN
ncbi:hypothetical protein COLO4_36904 [Corchorus olitorius]|uniref:Uncharacterized protein n=1 Tax=Corchorus olitorius TaxID=93759 RepID=A0A1R3G4H3_9ROSI|nr:hypothetical protein COLO4_36904 [Corchorus olitorius]